MTARLHLVSDNTDNPQPREAASAFYGELRNYREVHSVPWLDPETIRAVNDEPVDLYEQLGSVPEPDNNGRLIGLLCMALSAFIVVYFTFQFARPLLVAVMAGLS